MQDISKFAEELVTGYLATPDGQATAKKAIDDVVKRAIESATRYNSEFRKRVDAAMAKAIQVPEGFEVESYNDAILKIIAKKVKHATKDAIERQVAEQMKGLLGPIPSEIKLSELVEQYRLHLKDKHDSGNVCYGSERRMTFGHRRDGDYGVFHYYWLDGDPDQSEHKSEIRFGVFKDSMYHLAFESRDVENNMFVGELYGFERLLFQLKAAKAKLVLDCEPDDVDLYYASTD